MIGRTLDAMLSPLQIIGRECRKEGRDSILLYLAEAIRNTILPVEKCGYWAKKQGDKEEVVLYKDNWVIYFPEDWEMKRNCAKAFEKRRKVKVGETFKIRAIAHTGFGNFDKDFIVKRISDNAVVYRNYLISSSKDELIRNRDKGYKPILYRGVIW